MLITTESLEFIMMRDFYKGETNDKKDSHVFGNNHNSVTGMRQHHSYG